MYYKHWIIPHIIKTFYLPGYFGKGVYSKSSTSPNTISLFIIKYPCFGVIYDIMYIRSVSAFGNFKAGKRKRKKEEKSEKKEN